MATTRIRAAKKRLPRHLQPRKAPAQSRSAATVDAVLEAASRILVEKGFEGLSMQEVAKKAGVSPGSLYQYFDTKAALVAELIERLSRREVEFQLARIASLLPQADMAETLEAVVRGTLEFQREQGPLMRAALLSLPHLGRHPLLVERVATVSAALEGLLRAHEGEVPDGRFDLVTHVLVNAVHSLTHDGALPRPQWLDDETLAKEAKALVKGYLMARR